MIDFSEQKAKEENIKSIQLSVRETQDAAIKLFSGKNYKIWGENPFYAFINGSFVKGIYFYKNLVQIIPAIDLKDNKCVRLSKGVDDSSIVFNDDPEKQAIFSKNGCKKLHIVDLDAAFGRPDINITSIKKIRESISIPIQLGGGIRTVSDAKRYFDLGINNLIIGSMSVINPEQVKSLSYQYKNKIYISLDIKDDSVMIKGWKEKSELKLLDILNLYSKTDIKGYIITDIDNDGMLNGLNINFIKNIVNKIKNSNNNISVIMAGGLTNYDDLKRITKLNLNNIEGIVSGKSFKNKNIDLKKAQLILDTNG